MVAFFFSQVVSSGGLLVFGGRWLFTFSKVKSCQTLKNVFNKNILQ